MIPFEEETQTEDWIVISPEAEEEYKRRKERARNNPVLLPEKYERQRQLALARIWW